MAGAWSPAVRVAAWDAALAVVRDRLRGAGLREVSTPVRIEAGALEPFIEPIPVVGGWLRTSPELAHKRLLARGAGPLFEVAPVFRARERGARHREAFHLLEWYRLGDDLGVVTADVEGLVEDAFAAVARVAPTDARPPVRWIERGLLELVEETSGLGLRGDEDAAALRAAVQASAPTLWAEPPGDEELEDGEPATVAARDLAAWTAFFSTWSDAGLEPWLAGQVGVGVHVVDFPAPLAALAAVGPPRRPGSSAAAVAGRFESHVAGVELVNGYRELRDAVEQRRRFAAVARLRRALDVPPLPSPEAFLAELVDPGLPPCAGAALGIERLLLLAAGASSLDEVVLDPGA